MKTGPKETVYDEQIYSLMKQIIAICKEHKINMTAHFALDINKEKEPLWCSTLLAHDKADPKGMKIVQQAASLVKRGGEPPAIMGLVIRDETKRGA